MNTIDYRQYQPFFTKMLTRYSRNPNRPLLRRDVLHQMPDSPQSHCLCAMRNYPRSSEHLSPESMIGEYKFETTYKNTLSGMSKFRAYRRARGHIQYSRSYLGQFFVMFTGPRGILP
jgi:hypothetical protein